MRVIRIVLVLCVVLSLALTPFEVLARFRWSFASEFGWGINEDEVCQNSVRIILLNDFSYIAPGEDGYGEPPDFSNDFRVALYTEDVEPPSDSPGGDGRALEVFGPVVSHSHTYTATWHTVPFTRTDPFTQTYYQYAFATIFYSQTIDAGSPISIVIEGNGVPTMAAQVNPCTPTELDENDQLPPPGQRLFLPVVNAL